MEASMSTLSSRSRRPAFLAAAAAVAIGAAALPSAASAAPNIVDGGTYRIVPGHNNPATKTLEVPGASTANGVQIVQNRSPLTGSTAHQRFRVTKAGETGGRPYFRIRSTHVANKCFDVEGASVFNNARVVQFSCITGNRNQHFFLDSIFPGSTIHTITPRHSGLRLDITGASTGVGAGLQQFQDTGGRNQQFLFQLVG
jgi:hypothetical protein